MHKEAFAATLVAIVVSAVAALAPAANAAGGRMIGINVLLNTPPTDDVLAALGAHGRVRDVVPQINVVTLQAASSALTDIRALPYVAAANPDAARKGAPVDSIDAGSFIDGLSTWDQDAIDVTDLGGGRVVGHDGDGVYVAVLDTGLLDAWRQYLPEQRIAVDLARAFSGGGGESGTVSEQPNKWQHDQNSHGTHVASTILGYDLRGTPINGTAPRATVIPVKVLNQNGSGWSSVIARGIVYVADLKAGPLASAPVVINMSLGGPVLDAVEQAAIDYAIAKGVVVVASAGNEGEAGMGYPGAYAPVVSVAASGWTGQWLAGADGNTRNWWLADDVADPTVVNDFYIAGFSSRQKPGQDLDVSAPGALVVGPYQLQSGKTSYYFLSGTSMAAPHVAGIAALMLQKNPALTAADIETLLETSAIPVASGCRDIADSTGVVAPVCWDSDATGAGLATAAAALAATP